MFTGLIQALGSSQLQGQDRLQIKLMNYDEAILSDLEIGDSVAIDGVCLTVEKILAMGFVATVSPETLRRSTLGKSSQVAEWVNVETSLRVGSKIGGHFVSGHVDGIGCLLKSVATERAWLMRFGKASSMSAQWQEQVAPYLVTKGSIAVNGVSLTIADCDRQGSWFEVAVIPHTYQETNLCYLKPNDLVNLESDILGKYVSRLITHRLPGNEREISLTFLAENGYL